MKKLGNKCDGPQITWLIWTQLLSPQKDSEEKIDPSMQHCQKQRIVLTKLEARNALGFGMYLKAVCLKELKDGMLFGTVSFHQTL